MVNLPQVTLISVDTTSNPEDTIKALYTSMSGITFGSVKLIANKDKVNVLELESDGITVEEPVIPITNYNEYNFYAIYCLFNGISGV